MPPWPAGGGMLNGRPAGHWLMLMALVAMWGSSFVVNKVAVTALPPATVVAARLVIAAGVLAGLAIALRHGLPAERRVWRACAVMAVVGNALPFTLITWGQQRIDSGLAGILMAVMPLVTLILAHLFVAGERLTPRRVAGFLTGFAGIVVLIGPAALLELEAGGSALLAQLAVLSGAVCYAVNTILARRRPASEPLPTAAAVSIVGALLMVPPGLVGGGGALPAAAGVLPDDPLALAAVGYLGLIATALATVVYFRLVTAAGPSFLSYINYLIPLWAVGLGVVALDETPQASALAGLVLVLSGIALSEWRGGAPPGRAQTVAGDGDPQRRG